MVNVGLGVVSILAGALACLPAYGGLLAEEALPSEPLATVTTPATAQALSVEDNLISLALGSKSTSVDFTQLQANPLTGQPLYLAAQGIDFIPVTSGVRFGTLPEPGTLSLFGLGLLGWAFARHRRP